jgi:Na+/phosphate symporter
MFANQTQDEAYSNSVYFHKDNGGSTIFSYGRHFPMAHILKNGLLVVNCERYSPTTSEHQSILHNASSNLTKVIVKQMVYQSLFDNISKSKKELKAFRNNTADVGEKVIEQTEKRLKSAKLELKRVHRTNIEYYLEMIRTFIAKQQRARIINYVDDIYSYINRLRRYTTIFNCESLVPEKIRGLSLNSDLNTVLEAFGVNAKEIIEKFIEKVDKQRQASEQARKKKEVKNLEIINKWKAGDFVYCLAYTGFSYLRTHGGEVQTSQGIRLSTEQAKKVYLFVSKIWEQNKTWVTSGKGFEIKTLDRPWKLHSVTHELVTAGCHRIKRQEIEEFALKMGWSKQTK